MVLFCFCQIPLLLCSILQNCVIGTRQASQNMPLVDTDAQLISKTIFEEEELVDDVPFRYTGWNVDCLGKLEDVAFQTALAPRQWHCEAERLVFEKRMTVAETHRATGISKQNINRWLRHRNAILPFIETRGRKKKKKKQTINVDRAFCDGGGTGNTVREVDDESVGSLPKRAHHSVGAFDQTEHGSVEKRRCRYPLRNRTRAVA